MLLSPNQECRSFQVSSRLSITKLKASSPELFILKKKQLFVALAILNFRFHNDVLSQIYSSTLKVVDIVVRSPDPKFSTHDISSFFSHQPQGKKA